MKALVLLLASALNGVSAQGPCAEEADGDQLRIPCLCSKKDGEIAINCDNVAFPGDFPLLPFKMRIVEFSQRNAGIQALRSQLFTASDLPLRKVDFSRNAIRRLNTDVLEGLESHLLELRLDHNLLGNNYNPIFSSSEISNLTSLQTLNLAYNHIRALDTGFLKSLKDLQVLHLEGNSFLSMPTAALRGLKSLKVLTLQENDIDMVKKSSLAESPGLVFLNVSHNRIVSIEDEAFSELGELVTLDLSYNRLSSLKDGSFRGLEKLEELDLSSNFLPEIPADALKELTRMKTLVLHDNLIQTLGGVVALGPMTSLEQLDLTRNDIGELPTGTFRQLSGLRSLKLGVNSIRKVGEDAFEGLSSLEALRLDDDNILSIPWTALAKVRTLTSLSLDYNRVGVISSSSLQAVRGLQRLSIAHNIIRELPQGTFSNFTRLERLNFYGNQIQNLVPESLLGLRESLKGLNLGLNRLSELPQFDFPLLDSLVLSRNDIASLPSDAFVLLPELRALDLSENRLSALPVTLLHPLRKLSTLDLSRNRISEIRPGQFNGSFLNVISLRHNLLREVPGEAFRDLLFLHTLDLGRNALRAIGDSAFLNVALLHILRLDGNALPSFGREHFGLTLPASGTELRILDLGHNDIALLQPAAFRLHPKLSWLSLSHNRLSSFPPEVVAGLSALEHLDAGGNRIAALEGAEFANAPSLRELSLRGNAMETLSEAAFQNSTQLRDLDLSHNRIAELREGAFLGVSSLRLDLSHNRLSSLPEGIFQRTRLQKLQAVNLAHNLFERVPLRALRQQYFFLSDLNLAHNGIRSVPGNADVLVNIKSLDLSYNPLTPEAGRALLNEPKTARRLSLAGTNLTEVPVIEARFLLSLNLSDNAIAGVDASSFGLVRNLRELDLSRNAIPNLGHGLAAAWPEVPDLRRLDLSHNPVAHVVRGDLDGLGSLEVLRASHLPRATRVERLALGGLRSLRELHLHSLPQVSALDVRGVLEAHPGLEVVDVEVTDRELHDQLHPAFRPRLRSLTVRGRAVEALSGGAFAGIKSPELAVGLVGTGVRRLRSSVFFPVPMSSRILLDLSDSRIASLGAQFLATIDSRQRHLRLKGLGSNPLFCDCNLRALRLWLASREDDDPLRGASCSAPGGLKGRAVASLREEELTCEGRPSTTTTESPLFTTTARRRRPSSSSTTDSVIITFEDVAAKEEEAKEEAEAEGGPSRGLTNMDTVIIGIVGGVVAFVALLIVVICLVRLRADSQYRGGPMAGPFAMRQQQHGNCTCLKPPPLPVPPNWGIAAGGAAGGAGGGYPYPTAPSSRAGTLKMVLPPPPPPSATPVPPPYGGGRSFYPNHPYYLGYAAEGDHDHR